jgi:hypothetical protein
MEGLAKKAFVNHYNMPWNKKYRNEFDNLVIGQEDKLNQKYHPQLEQHLPDSPEYKNIEATRSAEWNKMNKGQWNKGSWNAKKFINENKPAIGSPATQVVPAAKEVRTTSELKVPKIEPTVPPAQSVKSVIKPTGLKVKGAVGLGLAALGGAAYLAHKNKEKQKGGGM